jgi:hypothetical protein
MHIVLTGYIQYMKHMRSVVITAGVQSVHLAFADVEPLVINYWLALVVSKSSHQRSSWNFAAKLSVLDGLTV